MEGLLQWVRGPRTAVMATTIAWTPIPPKLQWVRGPITAVMIIASQRERLTPEASMGPRSDNRGYEGRHAVDCIDVSLLQWVRGPITAVMYMDYYRRVAPSVLQLVR